MKKFRKSIDQSLEQMEKQWQSLPKARQALFTKIFFAGYVVLTFMVVLQIWLKDSPSNEALSIGHINNIPKGIVEKQTSSKSTHLKINNNGKYK